MHIVFTSDRVQIFTHCGLLLRIMHAEDLRMMLSESDMANQSNLLFAVAVYIR